MNMPAGRGDCVIIGEESLLIECGYELLEKGFSILAVIAENSQIVDWCKSAGITVLTPDKHLENTVADLEYDWFFSIANLRMLPVGVWRKARKAAINFHDGPLPRYAGLNTPAWAILSGETEYGVTWHALADGVDQGGIYVQRFFEISPNETTLTLNTKCYEAAITGFSDLLAMIESGSLEGRPQDPSLRSYFAKHKRPQAAATLDFSKTAGELDQLCRAMDFGQNYANPLAMPKVLTASGGYNVSTLHVLLDRGGEPGKVLSVDGEGAVVATAEGAVRIAGVTDAAGRPVPVDRILHAGDVLPALSPHIVDRLNPLMEEIVPGESAFRIKLEKFRALELYCVQPAAENAAQRIEPLRAEGFDGLTGAVGVAAIAASLSLMSGQDRFDVAFADDRLAQIADEFAGYIAPAAPLAISVTDDVTAGFFTDHIIAKLSDLRKKIGYCGDLISRTPRLTAPDYSIAIRLSSEPGSAKPVSGVALTFIVPAETGQMRVLCDTARLDVAEAQAILARLHIAAEAYLQNPGQRIADLPLMSPEDQTKLLYERNQTARDYDREALMHRLIERQAARTPDAPAVVCGGHMMTYAELDAAANAVAQTLIGQGAGPDTLVGIYMQRSVDLVTGVLGILKSGAAYIPLDPTYPKDRIGLMIEDSGVSAILTQKALADSVPANGPRIIAIEDIASQPSPVGLPEIATRSNHLAYVIYTSGSTGRPKGVMVEHRNVVNFFAAMDDRITVPEYSQPVWLAVTSLSFDISVLELFWTLTRGFKVVIHVDKKTAPLPRKRTPRVEGGMGFSLFFWGSDDGQSSGKYKLLLDGARYADTRGFNAVWTPERHFHAFGGPYPNPSVTGAAVAAVTKNLEVRAGSCVFPLHHPARIAEDWAVIDNITGGRVGLAAAAGWMPDDFVLRPENSPPNNKKAMLRDVEIVRRLWRGEKVTFEGHDGKQVDVVTQPRPIQPELPIWITTAGNPETYRDAARLGANVLTHLLGQSIPELAEKIQIYRKALLESGRNPADHKFTLMLHTLIGANREEVRELARQPMKNYLRSAAALIKQYAWAFPAFKKPQGVNQPMEIDLQTLEEEEMDAIVEFAFLRYFDDSGLFGTVDDAIARIEELKAIGVDEIGCLIDFGIDHDIAMKGLEPLAEVVAAINPQGGAIEAEEEAVDTTIAGLIAHHGVTHMQCTPSMATMMMVNEDDRRALQDVHHLFLGGEALQGTLLRDLRSATSATIENMYGPTETTIWSSTGPARDTETSVPLGTALANTQLYVLDARLRPVPQGLPGELFIAGDGVTRGYLNREELTQERFLSDPFVSGGRMYRTGDLVRIDSQGEIQFIGRTDHQVKVRGYRIELGEIEARIGLHPAVAEAVVVAREDKANDVRIVAYLRYKNTPLKDEELADHIRATLPDFMVPAHFVTMEKFPLTPNAKVDRKALPRPEERREPSQVIEFIVPSNDVQEKIADAFKRALGVERVGALDNFFALGGHSLLAVQVHRDLKKNVAPKLGITDIYRFPTVAGLAEHIQGGDQADKELSKVANRAAMRRSAMVGRRSIVTRGRETS